MSGHPFAGRLEDHPEGGFVLMHDGRTSPALTTYEAVSDYIEKENLDAFEVVRVRKIMSPSDEFTFDPKPYPPEGLGHEGGIAEDKTSS